jgi:ssDNA-binding Zn-finger/Zn-ribbon topoisomerase 1
MQKNYRNRTIEKAKPIERELITRVEKIFAERCPQCGKLYESLKKQSVKDSGGASLAYGTCPKCGARLCKYVEADTVRVVLAR